MQFEAIANSCNNDYPFKMKSTQPSVVLVCEPSLLRYWLERSLGESFCVSIFSNTEDALTFVESTEALDVLVTELNLGHSTLGGCNIARGVALRFPDARIFVFSDRIATNDYRLLILRSMKSVRLLTTLRAVFLARKLRREFLTPEVIH